MKKVKILVILFVFVSSVYAQSPQAFNYQAIARNADENPIEDTNISLQVSILKQDSSVYQENHLGVATNRGLFTIQVGQGNSTNDDFSAINWADGDYYLKVGIDVNGGADFVDIGEKVRLLSVPFALYAENSGNTHWKKNIDSLYFLNGNVGIGTTSPVVKLQVQGTVSVGEPGEGNTLLSLNSERHWQFRQLFSGSGTTLELKSVGGGGNKHFVINTSGRVGIGTILPEAKLDVFGSVSAGTGGESIDGNILLKLNSERGWAFKQLDSGAATKLELKSVGGGGNKDFVINTGGKVGIGTTTPSAKLDVNGKIKTKILEITGGGDGAEYFDVKESGKLKPGSLVIVDVTKDGQLTISTKSYDKKIAGVISGAGGVNPGITLKQEEVLEGNELVSLWGRVYVKATSKNGKIQPGDYLTSSSIPGYVMKATKRRKSRGAIIGKALTSLYEGEGLVLILIQLQ